MNHDPQDDLLQRYFDGEVSEAEGVQAKTELASGKRVKLDLHGLQTMRTQLQQASEVWTQDLDSDALFAKIEAGIGRERVPTERLRALSGGKPKSTARKAVEWTAFAVAAAATIGWLSWEFLPSTRSTIAHAGSEVIKVDFGDSTGKVIEVEGDQGQALIVVWIEDDKKSF